MGNEVAFILHKGYAISIEETEGKRDEKFYAHGFQFGSATTMTAAFELPEFHEYGNDQEELKNIVKGKIDDMGK